MIRLLLLIALLSTHSHAANSRASFPTLEDSSQSGVPLTKSLSGDSSSGKVGSTSFSFIDSSGNLVLPQLNASGYFQDFITNFPSTYPVTQSTSPWVVSGTVTANQGTSPWVNNISQFGGSNIVTGTGVSGSGIPRVTVSNDSNILATQSGAWTTGRTWTLSSGTDSVAATQSGTWTVQQGSAPWSVSQSGTWNVGLNAGSNLIGKVSIDQTTPGTTNAVQANAGTNLNTSLLVTSANLTAGTAKFQQVDGSGNVQPAGDVLTRKIFVQPTDGSNNQGYTASSEAKVLVTPLTNSSVVKAQLQDNAGTAIVLGQTTMSSSLPVTLASNQTGINTFLDKSGTGNITAQCTTPASCPANSTVTATTNGASATTFTILGTWVATLLFEGNDGNGNWTAVLGSVPGNGSTTASTGTNLVLTVPSGGFSQIRIRCSAYTSGTVNVTYDVSAGTSTIQVFNLTPSALQATVVGSGTAGTPNAGVVSVQGISGGTNLPVSQATASSLNAQVGGLGADGAAIVGNPVRVGGKDGSGNTQDILTDTAGNQAILLKDASANGITSTLEAGTAANKQALDVTSISTGTTRYFTTFATQQTAATAANATVFTMRNAAASTKTAIIENLTCRQGFNATNPITRTQQTYIFQRFNTATPTGGTALTAGQGDSSDGASQVTDIRFLDTGLTTTSVVFVANNLSMMNCDTTQGIICERPILNAPSAWKFAPGEGLAIRLGVTAVTGVSISCNVDWREQ